MAELGNPCGCPFVLAISGLPGNFYTVGEAQDRWMRLRALLSPPGAPIFFPARLGAGYSPGVARSAIPLRSGALAPGKPACKPGSVLGNHSSGIHVAVDLKRPTRKRARIGATPSRLPSSLRWALLPYLALLQVGFAMPSLLPSPRCALTAPFHPYRPSRACACEDLGGLLSVALSVGSRPPGVTWHLIRRSPDFPPPRTTSRRPGTAITRPAPRRTP